MKNTVVIYKSKYGSTEKYAHWLADSLKSDIFEASGVKDKDLDNYDNIIFGGGLYPSGISGISLIVDNYESIKDKNLVVFTVGLTLVDKDSVFDPLMNKTFTKDMLDKIKVFHLRGSIDYSKLDDRDSIMMDKLKEMLDGKKPEEISESYKALLSNYGEKSDFIDKKNIQPIVDYIRS